MFLTKTIIYFIYFITKKDPPSPCFFFTSPFLLCLFLSIIDSLYSTHQSQQTLFSVISITHIFISFQSNPHKSYHLLHPFLLVTISPNSKSLSVSSKRLHQLKMMMRKPDITTTRENNKPNHACGSNSNKPKLRKGLWSPDEDEKLIRYMLTNGHGCWSDIARNAGLLRCGKSCRLRWINYLRPDLKRGSFSPQEEDLIFHLHSILGNR